MSSYGLVEDQSCNWIQTLHLTILFFFLEFWVYISHYLLFQRILFINHNSNFEFISQNADVFSQNCKFISCNSCNNLHCTIMTFFLTILGEHFTTLTFSSQLQFISQFWYFFSQDYEEYSIVSSAKGCGFNSQGTHILMKKKCIAWMHCKSLWIKVSAKCINVNVNEEKSELWDINWELRKKKS